MWNRSRAQAINTLLFQKHSKNCEVRKCIYSVYKAKRNAEVANGVGKETEVIVLDADKIYYLDESELSKLSQVYDEELKYGIGHEHLKTIFTLPNSEKKGVWRYVY